MIFLYQIAKLSNTGYKKKRCNDRTKVGSGRTKEGGARRMRGRTIYLFILSVPTDPGEVKS